MNGATLNVQDVLREARGDGLRLRADGDRLVVNGDPATRARWRPTLVEMKSAILVALADASGGVTEAPPAIEARLADLVSRGAIDEGDAELCRRRWADDPGAWSTLLDACDIAARKAGR